MATARFQLEWANLDDGPEDGVAENPTVDDVEAILEEMVVVESGFVILSRGEQHYIQAKVGEAPGEPIVIEYRDGEADRHFEIDEEVFSPKRLTALFTGYLANPAGIAKAAKWKKLEI